ncbi:hypothetical protein HRG_011600 [Hirsutella rhossiliensis]|uniref:Uncharacterized protein n=1 Tax=Hirsutella rhossiliensis TaxID=111463 RepID=A0A9P8SCB3_9HYPO|nr:uncharacterized protein HRG_11600 [Hirsutella rhossiliensis]KAH0957453.1 hypothetical protein HRG_11600 [Hirsutella rhossiliensis]
MACQASGCTVTIVLATIIPSVVVLLTVALLCWRLLRRRSRLFNRGITPIDDEEIESWKSGTTPEKHSEPPPSPWRDSLTSCHRVTNSVTLTRKPTSVIVYQSPSQYGVRLSEDLSSSPAHARPSFDVPPTPVLARAPNARPGLTDEAVQGEDAFVSLARRQPCRLAKPPPKGSRHNRSKSSRATMSGTTGSHNTWYGQQFEYHKLPRRSADHILPVPAAYMPEFSDVHTSHSTPVRTSFDEEIWLGGLSPRPLIRKSEIGRAIG